MDAGILSEHQRRHYETQGWLIVDGLVSMTTSQLQGEVDTVAHWGNDGEWLHHYEMTDAGRRLARSENFTPYSEPLRRLLREGAIVDVAGALLGEPALLYKEKINYKLVGGAGFSPHQDAPAYPTVTSVLSVMIAVDDANVDNGCLFVASGRHQRLLEQDERGCLTREIVDRLDWQPVELTAGQTLFFHSLTPHRSGPNTSTRDRRALYPTYNAASEGDQREDYYVMKRRVLADADDPDRVRLSLIGDFEGRPA